jgi:hypothetical protein
MRSRCNQISVERGFLSSTAFEFYDSGIMKCWQISRQF